MSKIKEPKVTVNGETWKRFYSDPKLWEPRGECYHEDEVFWVDGEECDCESRDMDAVPNTAKVGVVSGTYCDKDKESHDFVDVFRAWVKKDKETSIEKVLVPKARLEALEQCYTVLVDMVESQDVDQDAVSKAVDRVKASEVQK